MSTGLLEVVVATSCLPPALTRPVTYVDAQDLVRGDSTWWAGRPITVESASLMLSSLTGWPTLVSLGVRHALFGYPDWMVLPWNTPFPVQRGDGP